LLAHGALPSESLAKEINIAARFLPTRWFDLVDHVIDLIDEGHLILTTCRFRFCRRQRRLIDQVDHLISACAGEVLSEIVDDGS
jgi:hypothetical protein